LAIESGITEVPCPACDEGIMSIAYDAWTGLGLVNEGVSVDDRTAKDGTINMLGINDSKLARIEMGLSGKPHDKALRTFSPEQSADFRKRVMMCSGKARAERKLFDELIKTRKENLEKKK
jgi:hypothetical protein